MIAILSTLAIMLVLLLLKGFFSGAEIALVSADRLKLRHKAVQGSAGARLASRLLERPAQLLTTTLLGTNISSIALTTIGTVLMVQLLDGSGEFLAVIIFTPLFLILGEIVPKSIYQQKADTLVPILAYPLAWIRTILAPLVWLFSMIAAFAARLVSGSDDAEDVLRDQFVGTVQMAEATGANEAFSRGQVGRVIRFAQMTAAEAMWSASEVQLAEKTATMAELIKIRRDRDQRLIPLYDGSPVNITAIAQLEFWDLMDPEIEKHPTETILSPLFFVPQAQRVSEILKQLQEQQDSTAVVIDDQQRAIGFITLPLLVRHALGADANPVAARPQPR